MGDECNPVIFSGVNFIGLEMIFLGIESIVINIKLIWIILRKGVLFFLHFFSTKNINLSFKIIL